jgi:hypothetical protein
MFTHKHLILLDIIHPIDAWAQSNAHFKSAMVEGIDGPATIGIVVVTSDRWRHRFVVQKNPPA